MLDKLVCPKCKGAGKLMLGNRQQVRCGCCKGKGRINYFKAPPDLRDKLAAQYAS